MLYVTKFEDFETKSFTQVAMHNAKSLQTQNVNFELTALNNMIFWSQLPDWVQDLNPYFKDCQSDNKSAIVHLLPQDLGNTYYKGKDLSIAYTTFETTFIVKWIVDVINENYKGMIVPSEFNRQALQTSGVDIPIEVVPHTLHPMYFQDITLAEKNEKEYIFGYVGHFNPRKNPRAVLDTYLKTFPKNGNTKLILKTYNAGDLEGYIESVCGEEREDVWIYDESWSENQMLWVYSMIDCYVSAHKGEGFGLGLAQSAALGKPVIYTDFSAPTEWLKEEKGHYPVKCSLINVKKEDVHPAYHISYDPKLEWAEIDTNHLAERMQYVYENDIREGFNQENLSAFRKMLSWESAGLKFCEAYENIMGVPIPKK